MEGFGYASSFTLYTSHTEFGTSVASRLASLFRLFGLCRGKEIEHQKVELRFVIQSLKDLLMQSYLLNLFNV